MSSAASLFLAWYPPLIVIAPCRKQEIRRILLQNYVGQDTRIVQPTVAPLLMLLRPSVPSVITSTTVGLPFFRASFTAS